MNRTIILISLLLFVLSLVAVEQVGGADEPSPPLSVAGEKGTEMKQFLIVLHPNRDPDDPSEWSEEDGRIVNAHFAHLVDLQKKGSLILAGRTQDSESMGLVIFEAPDVESAKGIMQADPAVKSGLFTAELHPYRVALGCGSAEPKASQQR